MRINPDNKGQTHEGKYVWRPLIQHEPDDFPPNSKFWLLRARKELDVLQGIDNSWEEWYNNEIPDEATCKDIATMILNRIQEMST
jgi:hypothetical protein